MIQQYERYQWNYNNWPYPLSKYRSCGEGYHIDYEKCDYNMHYLGIFYDMKRVIILTECL